MMMHHHAKFGSKRFSSSADIFRTKANTWINGQRTDRQTDNLKDRQTDGHGGFSIFH